MKNLKLGLASLPIVIIVLVLLAGGAYFYSKRSTPASPITTPAPAPAPAAPDNSFRTLPPAPPAPQPASSTRNVRVDMNLAGVKVDIYRETTLITTQTTDSDGRFQVDLQVGQPYTLNFSKPGYQSKALTKVIPADTYGVGAYSVVSYLDPA